jgi:hypothetical protein
MNSRRLRHLSQSYDAFVPRSSPRFWLAVGGCLLCTCFLCYWACTIMAHWIVYRQLATPPVVAWAVLGSTLGFLLLSGVMLHLSARVRDFPTTSHKGVWEWAITLGMTVFLGATLSLAVDTVLIGHTIDAPMTRTGFVYRQLFLLAGQQVRFINPPGASLQVLCVGTKGHCLANAQAPDDLSAPGLRLLPSQAKTVTFPIPGDYPVVSLTTPGMAVTVHVGSDPDTGGSP